MNASGHHKIEQYIIYTRILHALRNTLIQNVTFCNTYRKYWSFPAAHAQLTMRGRMWILTLGYANTEFNCAVADNIYWVSRWNRSRIFSTMTNNSVLFTISTILFHLTIASNGSAAEVLSAARSVTKQRASNLFIHFHAMNYAMIHSWFWPCALSTHWCKKFINAFVAMGTVQARVAENGLTGI